VVSGLERMFMGYPPFLWASFRTGRRAGRSGTSRSLSEIPGSCWRTPRN